MTIFTARVKQIEDIDSTMLLDGHCDKTLLQRVTLKVVERFQGPVDDQAVVLAGDINGFYFIPARNYLVVASRNRAGNLAVTAYGGTKLLKEAADDIAFIRSFPKHAGGGEIFGEASFSVIPSNDRHMYVPLFVPMRGTMVVMDGPAKVSVTVGQDGKFRSPRVPPGRYQVRIDHAGDFYPATLQTVDLQDRGCGEVDFQLAKRATAQQFHELLHLQGRSVPKWLDSLQ